MFRLIAVLLLLSAAPVAATAQTSKFGIPSTSGAGGVQLLTSTVAQLPNCDASHAGILRAVTDANAPTFGSTLSGGSTTKVMAYCNGVNWVAY